MMANKQKSSCAYASMTMLDVESCRSKEMKQMRPFCEERPEEMLYDDLLDQLEYEDSEYIKKICKNN